VTRKDYVALAEALESALPKHRLHDLPQDVWLDCMEAVAEVLGADNPRFDGARFVRACLGAK